MGPARPRRGPAPSAKRRGTRQHLGEGSRQGPKRLSRSRNGAGRKEAGIPPRWRWPRGGVGHRPSATGMLLARSLRCCCSRGGLLPARRGRGEQVLWAGRPRCAGRGAPCHRPCCHRPGLLLSSPCSEAGSRARPPRRRRHAWSRSQGGGTVCVERESCQQAPQTPANKCAASTALVPLRTVPSNGSCK